MKKYDRLEKGQTVYVVYQGGRESREVQVERAGPKWAVVGGVRYSQETRRRKDYSDYLETREERQARQRRVRAVRALGSAGVQLDVWSVLSPEEVVAALRKADLLPPEAGDEV